MNSSCSQDHSALATIQAEQLGLEPDARESGSHVLGAAAAEWLRLGHEVHRYTLIREIKRKRLFRFVTGLTEPSTIIVKTWAIGRGSALSRIKRQLFVDARACEKEYQIARHLENVAPGLKVPRAIARFHRMSVLGEHCEVLLTEDLGSCDTLLAFINSNAGDEGIRLQVEDFIVDSSRALLLDARVIDEDHSAVNMVRSASAGDFHRIDFEVAEPWDRCLSPARAIGGMLARLTVSYAFACQPEVKPVERLVGRLVLALQDAIPRRAWTIAYQTALRALERQRVSKGIDMRPDLSIMKAAGRKQ